MASLSAVLSEVATVRTISLFRDRPPEPNPSGNVAILTIKDLTGHWPVDFYKLPRTHVNQEHLEHGIKTGDILMPARGDHYPARHIVNITDITLFPAGQIHVITCGPGVSSGFLAWYLNSIEVQTAIQTLLTGTNIQSLNKTRLLTLPLRIPTLQVQQEISSVQEKKTKWTALMHELIELRCQEVELGCRKRLNTGI